MRLGDSGQLQYQATVRDDFQTVVGRPATKVYDWARQTLIPKTSSS